MFDFECVHMVEYFDFVDVTLKVITKVKFVSQIESNRFFFLKQATSIKIEGKTVNF